MEGVNTISYRLFDRDIAQFIPDVQGETGMLEEGPDLGCWVSQGQGNGIMQLASSL